MRRMRDSGVAWIGEVPADWSMGRLGALYTLRNEKVSDKDYPPLSVTMKGVLPQLETAAKTEDGDNRKLVCVGDFAINSRSDRRGSCGISAYDGSVSLINTIITPRGEMNPGYYNWLFHTTYFADEFYKWGHGIVDDLWTTRWSEMKRIIVPVPSYKEQKSIASFLDSQCAEIDAAIEDAKTAIEEFKAYKKALICEMVTGKWNGAGSHAAWTNRRTTVAARSLQNSGVDWIGDIPVDWQVIPLRHLGSFANGISKSGDMFGRGSPFVSYSDVYKNDCIPSSVSGLVESDAEEQDRYSVKRGDVFFTRTSETIEELGMAGACLTTIPGATFAGFLIRFRPSGEVLLPEYSKYYFRNEGLRTFFSKESMIVTRASLSQELLKSLPVLVPPLEIQREIAAGLDVCCGEIDAAVDEKQRLIVDLRAYKKSLVFETVTGKREVA